MITETQLTRMITAHLEGSDLFLADVTVKSGNRIAVFIDGDHGVTIDHCRDLNRFLNEQLDRDTEDYDLTVSSYGADRPLKLPRQYMKNTGRMLDIVTNEGIKITGKVLQATNEGLELEITPSKKQKKDTAIKIESFRYTDIKTAKEVISFKQ